MKRLFITGTDTGVGKTTVGCALAAAYTQLGRRVEVLKPIETGCEGLELRPADALRLAQAVGLPPNLDYAQLCPQRFALPASPEVAARAEGRAVDRAALEHALDRSRSADLLLVEGAGGLLVPIADDFDMADLAERSGAALLIVARASLGTVNHSLLTLEAARRRGLRVAGVVLNQVQPPAGPDEPTNAEAIARHGAVRVLGTLPHVMPPASDPIGPLARLAREHLDLQGLWDAL